ncbi:MAG: ribosomal-processing cysteine protease Prp [Erysipelotrichaceae bacterium]|nr:ribosomal-processing cysteine protease Prp [Erysipelotrichaceae bacterium]MDP3306212.1 ribosomal-processing cysteine protease Prp [Erysipelotrichaceae bacterium]
MIQVHIKITKDDHITFMSISGHAKYDVKGKDLVCAAVSAISVGGLNSLVRMAKDTVHDQLSENKIEIQVIKLHETQQNILKTMLYQLETVEYSYSKYIQITKQEV